MDIFRYIFRSFIYRLYFICLHTSLSVSLSSFPLPNEWLQCRVHTVHSARFHDSFNIVFYIVGVWLASAQFQCNQWKTEICAGSRFQNCTILQSMSYNFSTISEVCVDVHLPNCTSTSSGRPAIIQSLKCFHENLSPALDIATGETSPNCGV